MISQITNTTGVMHLTWILNNVCNRACDYCPTSLHSGKNHHVDWAHAELFIEELTRRYPRIHVTISGGEPTMSPYLLDLVRAFRSRGHTIGITSNAVRSVRYYEELAPYLRFICLSWHPNPQDPDFPSKVAACSEHTLTKVNLMMPADSWAESIKMHQELSSNPDIIWEPFRITQWHNEPRGIASRSYTREQVEWFAHNTGQRATMSQLKKYDQQLTTPTPLKSTTNLGPLDPGYLINNNLNNFQGWSCSQGLESLFVQYTGQVGLSNCSQNRDIGWIQELDDIVWPEKEQTCTLTRCDCVSDIYISKHVNTRCKTSNATDTNE